MNRPQKWSRHLATLTGHNRLHVIAVALDVARQHIATTTDLTERAKWERVAAELGGEIDALLGGTSRL